MAAASTDRDLLVHAPSRTEALKRQRSNLLAFWKQNSTAFDALRYDPFTAVVSADRTVPRQSHLDSALIGVFPTSRLEPSSHAADYPGMLMSVELHDAFHRVYHCPTAVTVPELDYHDEATGRTVRMVLVGDPTRHGPNVNDGGEQSNCELVLGPQPWFEKDEHGKIVVHSSFLSVRVLARAIEPAEELLMRYDKPQHGTFWDRLSSAEEHCAVCFKTCSTEVNPLVMCEQTDCSVGRHKWCFPDRLRGVDLDCTSVRFSCSNGRPH